MDFSQLFGAGGYDPANFGEPGIMPPRTGTALQGPMLGPDGQLNPNLMQALFNPDPREWYMATVGQEGPSARDMVMQRYGIKSNPFSQADVQRHLLQQYVLQQQNQSHASRLKSDAEMAGAPATFGEAESRFGPAVSEIIPTPFKEGVNRYGADAGGFGQIKYADDAGDMQIRPAMASDLSTMQNRARDEVAGRLSTLQDRQRLGLSLSDEDKIYADVNKGMQTVVDPVSQSAFAQNRITPADIESENEYRVKDPTAPLDFGQQRMIMNRAIDMAKSEMTTPSQAAGLGHPGLQVPVPTSAFNANYARKGSQPPLVQLQDARDSATDPNRRRELDAKIKIDTTDPTHDLGEDNELTIELTRQKGATFESHGADRIPPADLQRITQEKGLKLGDGATWADAVKQLKQSRAMDLQKSGPLAVQQAQLNVPDKLTDAEIKDVVQATTTLKRADRIARDFDSQFVGPMRGRYGSMKEFFGKTGYSESKLRAEVAKMANDTIRLQTGLAIQGSAEQDRIMAELVNMNLAPEAWKARWDMAVDNLRELAQMQRDVFRQAGRDTSKLDPLPEVRDLNVRTPQAEPTAPGAPAAMTPAAPSAPTKYHDLSDDEFNKLWNKRRGKIVGGQ